MVAAPITVTQNRARAVDFSHPFQSVGPVIVLKRPDHFQPPLKESLSKLLVPLEFSVWLMACLAFFATGTTLYIISYFNPYEWRRMAKDREATLREAESFTCLNSFWFALSTMAWQGKTCIIFHTLYCCIVSVSNIRATMARTRLCKCANAQSP